MKSDTLYIDSSRHIYRDISRIAIITLLMFSMLGLSACKKQVTRVAADEVTDLSGQWNDTDSRLVSREMVEDVLSQRWLTRYRNQNNKAPTVIVGRIRNLSHEHINTRTFIADIERALINSGEVDFVASADERGDVRKERMDQDLNASAETRKAAGQETGADYMLKGSINSIVDAIEGEQARFYQVDLNLIDLESNRKVWVGQKKIKKTIEKSGLRW